MRPIRAEQRVTNIAQRHSRTGAADDAASTPGEVAAPPRQASRFLALWPYAVILVVGLFVLLPKLGNFGFWDPWEPKYIESVREMLERDSYFVPYYRDEVRLTKPILVYWGILAGTAVFGLNEFGARIGGVGLALASMLGVYYSISRLRGRQAGLLSALVLGTLPLFFLLARQSTPDVYLFTTLGSSLVFFCLAAFGPDRRRDLHFIVSYACFSLAVLAKGPVIAFPVFFGPMVLYLFVRIDFARLWHPDLRPQTVRVLLTGLPAAVLLVVFALTAFLLGTSPVWWGFSENSRSFTFRAREHVWGVMERFHFAEWTLAIIVLLGAWWVYRRIRSGSGNDRFASAAFPAALALAAATTLVGGDPTRRALVAAMLGGLICPVIVFADARRLLLHPGLQGTLQPYFKPFVRQVVVFLVVFLVVAGPWHLVVFFQQRHGYFTDFILKHNVARFGDVVNSSGSADFYFRTLVYGLFPWCCFLPIALAATVRWWQRDALRRYGVEAFLVLASVVIFASFSTSATKFSYYLAPILIPLAVLIGILLDRAIKARNAASARLVWAVALLLYLVPVVNLLDPANMKYVVGTFTVKRMVPDFVPIGHQIPVLMVIGALVLGLLVLVRSRLLIAAFVVCAALLGHHLSATFIPTLTPHKTMKHLTDAWYEYRHGEEPLCIHGGMKHGVVFYTRSNYSFIRSDASVLEFMRPENEAFCIVKRDSVYSLAARYRRRYPDHTISVIEKSHFDYVLVANRSMDELRAGGAALPATPDEP